MKTLIGLLLMATSLAPVAAAAQEVGVGADAGISRRGELARIRANAGVMDRGRREDAPRDEARAPRPQIQEAPRQWQGQPRPDQGRPDQGRPDQSRFGRPGGDRSGGDRPGGDRPDRGARDDDGARFGMDQRYPRGRDTIRQAPDRRDDRDGNQWRSGRGGYDRPDVADRRRDDPRNGGVRNDRRYDPQRRVYGAGYGSNNGWRDQAYDRGRFDDRRAWNRGWRTENRYDWNRYRSVNRGAYHLPRYYAPHGWNSYRRLSIGISLAPQLWGQNYWIADPWTYRLPDADDPYRWVRYYDDALLVDLDSGQVVDVVYGIFW